MDMRRIQRNIVNRLLPISFKTLKDFHILILFLYFTVVYLYLDTKYMLIFHEKENNPIINSMLKKNIGTGEIG